MSEQGDPGCLGLCDIDWEQGLCLGCGRSTEEIYGPQNAADEDAAADGPMQ
ncbi:MAG: DUF1289 domain-containing protein [Pseudazoarcus pumilus]|nr:DUF1289 domain-containing protein [Pseudazoarcus pumilus]